MLSSQSERTRTNPNQSEPSKLETSTLMESLPERKRILLHAVVVEYVAGAEPIASELLTVKYDLGVRSATVRNELAEMSEQGYLEQPHTSAGRIPSDKGYRFYIDNLLQLQPPENANRKQVKTAQEGEALRELLSETTRVLSRMTHLLSVATTVKGANVMVKSAIVSAFGPHQALVVLGLSNGDVHNKLVECPTGLTLADVGQINEWLQRECINKPIRTLPKLKIPGELNPESGQQLAQITITALKGMARELTRGKLVTHGEEFLFGQPEYRHDASMLANLVDQFKQTDLLIDSLHAPSDETTPVTIGKEHRNPELHHFSMVRQTFYVGSIEAGTIAVIGPTRMDYANSIPMVNYTARTLSEALTRFAGS